MDTFSQIYVMAVWGVKYRLGLIDRSWRQQLYSVIGRTLKDFKGVMPLKIGGTKDHVHVLFSTTGEVPEVSIIRQVKSDSSRWINANRLTQGRFEWQRGSGRFSYSYSALPQVKAYIENQEEHHKHFSFREEYARWLEQSGVTPNQYNQPDPLE